MCDAADNTPDPDPLWTDQDEAEYREQQYYLGADAVEDEDAYMPWADRRKHTELYRQRREQARQTGNCYRCGKPAWPHLECPECLHWRKVKRCLSS